MEIEEEEGRPKEEAPELSNSSVKSSPLFLKVTRELGELKALVADREAAEIKVKEEEAIQKATAAGEFEKAIELHTQKLEALERKHSKEILDRDLTTALVKAGAKNDVFLKGAVSSFDGATDISEYVKMLSENEENGAFFGDTETQRQIHRSPSAVAPSGLKSWDQIRVMEQSSDPKQRLEASRLIMAHILETGKMPPD